MFPGRATPSCGQRFSRDTRHETRLFPWLVWYLLVLKPFSLFFGRETVYVESDDAVAGNENLIRARRGRVGWGRKSRPVAAFLRVVARHGAAMARHGRHGPPRPHQQQGLSGFHETRDPRHGYCQARGASRREFRGVHESRDTNHESRLLCFPTHDFPRFLGISQYFPTPPTPPGQGSARRSHLQYDRLGFHDTRDTNHGLYRRAVAAFLRVVARHGAAMVRHGRHGAPRAVIRAPSAPATGPFGFSRNTRPETRGTAIARRAARGALWAGANSEVFTSYETRITAFMPCSSLFTIVHHCSLLFSKKYYPGQRRSPQLPSPPGRSRCGQPKMNPCRERGTFDIVMTHFYRGLNRPGSYLDTHSPVWHTPPARWFSSGYGIVVQTRLWSPRSEVSAPCLKSAGR